MKIQKITVNNFKGIDRLEFEPRMLNLIVGKNNSGKTSLLECINLLSNTDKIKKLYRKHLSALINVRSKESIVMSVIDNKQTVIILKKPTVQAIIIDIKKELIKNLKGAEKIEINEEMDKEIENILNNFIDEENGLELLKESIVVTTDGKDKIYFSFGSKKLKELLNNIVRAISKNMKEKFKLKIDSFMLLLRILRRFPRELTQNESELNKNIFHVEDLRLNEKEEKTEEDEERIREIEDYIKKYKLENHLESFDLDFLTYKYGEKREVIPYSFTGEGFKALIGLLWHLTSKNIENKIVLLEEPDTYMHPEYIQQLVKFIIKSSKDMNIQFFITSHNIDFIELLFEESMSIEERKYLEKELLILRMEKIKNHITSELFDYKEAKSKKEKLLIDLRGN